MLAVLTSVIIITLLFFSIYLPVSIIFSTDRKPAVHIELQINHTENIEIFYDVGRNYNLNDHVSKTVEANPDFQVVKLSLSNDTLLKSLRIDLGALPAGYRIKRISLINHYGQRDFVPDEIITHFKPDKDINQYELKDNAVWVNTTGEDPIILSRFDIDKEFKALGKIQPKRRLSLIVSACICMGILLLVGTRVYNKYHRPSRSILFVGFIAMISTPLFLNFLGLNKKTNDGEFRVKAEAPRFSLNDWELYIKRYTAYFEDQFGLRPEMIKFYSDYKRGIWKSSPVPDKVIIGRNNWLYTVEDSLMEDFRGLRKFNIFQLEEIKNNLMYRKRRLEANGIEYYIVIAPNKQTIYPEYVPMKYSIVDSKTRWMQTRDFLNANGINFIIDPTDTLLKSKQTEMPYFKTDLHWNNYGAFVASQMLLKEIGMRFSMVKSHPITDYKVSREKFTKGDMARMINAEYHDDVEYKFDSPGLNSIQYFPGPSYPSYVSSQPVILTVGTDTAKPNILMFKDSFGNGMTQFVSEESYRAVYVWTHVFDWAIIEQEEPDIVIHEISEKLIHKFLEE